MQNGKDEAEEFDYLTVGSGKKIKLRQPSGGTYILAFKLAGQDISLVPVFQALLCVVAINGEAQPKPVTPAKMEALAERVGFDGVSQIVMWHGEKTNPELMEVLKEDPNLSPQEAAALADERRKEKVKNLSEIQ